MQVSVHEAKIHLSRLLRRVACGEEVVIARSGKPVARLVPVEPKARRVFGTDAGVFRVPDDFDAPLPTEMLNDFESRDSFSTATVGSGFKPSTRTLCA